MRRGSLLRLVILLGALVSPAVATADPGSLPELPELPVTSVVLSNGLRVLLAPDPLATLTSVRVSYDVGAADDPNGLRGLAQLTEHLVAGQTKHIVRVLRLLAASGASDLNATTTLDQTSYFETLPPERLETALWVESERMGYAAEVVTEARVVSERAVVHNEERERRHDAVLGAAWAFSQHQLFPEWHPYSTAADDDADFDLIHASDVQAFVSTWYSPRNAVLAVAGRFDRERALALVRRYFESLPSPEPPARPTLRSSSTEGARLVVSANAVQDAMVIEWRTPSFGTHDDASLDLAATILSLRLQRSLVATHLATRVSARQASNRESSVFRVTATCAPGKAPSVLLKSIQATVDGMARDITSAEVERARVQWRRRRLSSLETVEGRTSVLVSNARLGDGGGPRSSWGLARYENLTESEVGQGVATWLRPERRVATTTLVDHRAPLRGRLVRREGALP